MENNVRYSTKALRDLDDIYDYIKNNLYNIEAAIKTVEGIINEVDKMVDYPLMGSKLIFDTNIDSGYHYVKYKNYLAFYRIVNDKDIYVDRILYSRRDYLKLLCK